MYILWEICCQGAQHGDDTAVKHRVSLTLNGGFLLFLGTPIQRSLPFISPFCQVVV